MQEYRTRLIADVVTGKLDRLCVGDDAVPVGTYTGEPDGIAAGLEVVVRSQDGCLSVVEDRTGDQWVLVLPEAGDPTWDGRTVELFGDSFAVGDGVLIGGSPVEDSSSPLAEIPEGCDQRASVWVVGEIRPPIE